MSVDFDFIYKVNCISSVDMLFSKNFTKFVEVKSTELHNNLGGDLKVIIRDLVDKLGHHDSPSTMERIRNYTPYVAPTPEWKPRSMEDILQDEYETEKRSFAGLGSFDTPSNYT